MQLHVVRGDEVLAAEHSEQSLESGAARDTVEAFLAGVRENVPGVSIVAAGHRIVHGGVAVRAPTVVDDEVVAGVGAQADLAPQHMPPALELLRAARECLPGIPHVLCPDTAFHADLPESAAAYALPWEWRRRYGLRRYGFHGLSYAWAMRQAAGVLGRPVDDLRMVLTHLGGGCSVCAVHGGRSMDTSMGFTPLEGVPMSKRSGSVDPGMLLWLLSDSRLSLEELKDGLQHRSGLYGLSEGRSHDTRELVKAGDDASLLALSTFAHRVAREVAAEATSLDRLDALVFTGEIGWDQPEVREAVCGRLSLLGVEVPAVGDAGTDRIVSAPGARVPVVVVEPREELQLARETLALLYLPEGNV